MIENILAYQKINFAYPSQKKDALKSLSLEIAPGSITAVLGPNGAGKTTLLHLALGWLQPRLGRVFLNTQELGSYTRREIGQWMGLVPQNERVPFDYSVLNYVLFGRTPYLQPLEMPGKEDILIAQNALYKLGLEFMSQRSVSKLSGGERQMVMVARALTQQPRLLLLDEPTSHLDISNKSRLITLLRQLAAEGVTILFTTHEPDVASALAEQIVLMRQGEVLVSGSLEEVFTSQGLSDCYQTPVRVVNIEEHRVALWS